VTLSSYTDLYLYPSNQGSAFTNKFDFDFASGQEEWECALTDLFCSPTLDRTLFDSGDNIINVKVWLPDKKVEASTIPTADPVTSVLGWRLVKMWNKAIKENKIEGVLVAFNTSFGFIFSINNPNIEKLMIPEDVQKKLGFKEAKPILGQTTIRSDFPPSDDLLATLPYYITFTVVQTKHVQLVLPPTIIKDEADLSSMFNSVFEKENLGVSIGASGSNAVIKFDPTFPHLSMTFPESLNQIFRFPPGHVIKSEEETLEIEKLNLRAGNDIYLIQSNAIERQYYCGKRLGLLRQVLQPAQDGILQHLTFKPLLYVPVSRDNFSSLTTYISNESGEGVSFGETPVTVTLHFRIRSS